MKHLRGFLVAGILGAVSLALTQFAKNHWVLIDMVYPYVSRMIQTYLSNRHSGGGQLWQTGLVIIVLALIVGGVYLFLRKKKIMTWVNCVGWVLAAVMTVSLLSTGIYGLNKYAGPIADDIRLDMSEYSLSELTDATLYYQEKANDLAKKVARNEKGFVDFPAFDALAEQAAEGFRVMTYEEAVSVFAGSTKPVDKLAFSGIYKMLGITQVLQPLTGEAAVNPKTPAVGLPFAMCRVMAKRSAIANEQDAAMAAFLACSRNPSAEFQYSAYFMAYRYCYSALETLPGGAEQYRVTENTQLRWDVDHYNNSFAAKADDGAAAATYAGGPERNSVPDMLVSWHIQKVVLPMHLEDETTFDPMDETQVDLSGLPHVKK